MRALLWWRHVALAGLVAGLISARPLQSPPGWLAVAVVAAIGLVVVRPTASAGRPIAPRVRRLRDRAPPAPAAALLWLGLLAATAAVAGLGVGDARLTAIADGAAPGEPGARVTAIGHVGAPPRATLGELRFPLRTADGTLLVVARAAGPAVGGESGGVVGGGGAVGGGSGTGGAESGGSAEGGSGLGTDLGIGDLIRVTGRLTEPEDWRAGEAERSGAALELHAGSLRRLSGKRAGLPGLLDEARDKAERGVAAGLDPEQEALARGFVLGQDDRIDDLTREQFRRSGLAHLLAVSGQNVMLLAILAGVLLALAGIGPRARLVAILLLIAAYVPLAGAGPSIQRAGVMGAAGILAGLAGRARDRAYLPLLAAAVTLLINPHAAAEVGWQLSFAAVIGISLWARPIAELLGPRLRGGPLPERIASPLAEGASLTIAATVATAPLMALHFETVSLASLPANLLVLPAVAPVMWLGMLAGLIGQLPMLPTAPLALIEGRLLDYIAAVADVFSRPRWAVISLPSPSPATVAAVYACLIAGSAAAVAALRRRDGHGTPRGLRVALAGVLLTAALSGLLGGSRSPTDTAPDALRVTALDVGQGDAILLDGPAVPAVLVDTGPPGAGVADALRAAGVERLAALAITHHQLDHDGALREVLRAVAVDRLLLARPARESATAARAAGAEVLRIGEGAELRFGRLRVQVLSPRAAAPEAADPNADSLVLAARFAGWTALLTGDAEAEATTIDPGPFDVLKLAHHGSADAGLGAMLDRSGPRVALISVGAGNSYGHPTPETLAELGEHGVCILRTDTDGDVWAELAPGSLQIGSDRSSGGDRCAI